MAKPTAPIEIWAVKDVVLPVSNHENKIRPIDDLWNKGYDLGEKPAVEEWNYTWNMTTSWLKYISEEQIPGLDERYLQRSLNLSDLGDKAKARTNLEVYSKTESETRYVNVTGDTMTGNLGVPRINFTKVDGTDFAYMEAVTPGTDTTYLDVVIGDNPGNPTTAGIDVMRWRFTPSGGTTTSMMELNSLDGTNAYLRVFGQIWGRQLNVAGDVTWTGAGKGASLALTGALSAASLNVTGQSAVVGGRNVVRAINGITADANGNLSLPLATTAFSSSPTGWWRDNSTGMIIQWGYGSWRGYNNEELETVNFPIAFPNACLSVNTGTQYQGETIRADCWGAVAGFNRQFARLQTQWSGDSEWEVGARATYIAIGY